MAKQNNIIWAFDLDGTIAPYGGAVTAENAKKINELGHVHIITGGEDGHARKMTAAINEKTIHAIRAWSGNKAIDCAAIMDVTKEHFKRSSSLQKMRSNLCRLLRQILHDDIYIGGRSTIDIMPCRNKGQIIRKLQANGSKVIYFYDCMWPMNDDINNDVPAVKEAWKSVKTNHHLLNADINKCLKENL